MQDLTFLETLQKHQIPVIVNGDSKHYTTLKISNRLDYVVEVENVAQVIELLKLIKQFKKRYIVLGNGSNTLIKNHFNGVVIALNRKFNRIQVNGSALICQSGADLKQVCLTALEEHLTGLEFAYGIPASVGGALYMNAGAYGGEIATVFKKATFINENNEVETIELKESDFGYRHSPFTNRNVCILEVEVQLQKGNYDAIEERMDELMAKRIAKQPLDYPSAGSTFKRPEGHYASALIDQCGLKGKKHKGAMVSDKHAGFLLNYHNATSEEFLELIAIVKQEVFEKSGYELACEVKIVE